MALLARLLRRRVAPRLRAPVVLGPSSLLFPSTAESTLLRRRAAVRDARRERDGFPSFAVALVENREGKQKNSEQKRICKQKK
jgi:hypothetical protein